MFKKKRKTHLLAPREPCLGVRLPLPALLRQLQGVPEPACEVRLCGCIYVCVWGIVGDSQNTPGAVFVCLLSVRVRAQ